MPKSAAAQKKSAESDVAESNSVQKETTKLEAVKEDSPKKDEKKSHYPKGTKLFSYKPKDGSEVIELPTEFDFPDKKWLWRISKLPFLGQTFEWLNRALVPNAVQEQVVSLNDDEYPELFSKWFEACGGATVGE